MVAIPSHFIVYVNLLYVILASTSTTPDVSYYPA
jgi:hypothetical protein